MIKLADRVPVEFTPFVGPDSLRHVTRLMKNLYDLHTKRYCGYTDINGSQYEGTVENWGAESLLEARKMLLDKPALANIFIENSMDFYLDIQYADMLDNYHQQNMLCGTIRKNVLLSNNTYRIRFDNVELFNVPRSESYSDPKVFNDKFYHTTTPPTLVITDALGNDVEEVLKVTDVTGAETDYYFHLGLDTIGMYDDNSYDESTSTFTTLPLDDTMNGIGCVWICVNLLRTLPIVSFTNNILDEKTFMTIGTNGHDISLMYPLFNYTEQEVEDYSYYIIKVIAADGDAFFDNSLANYSTKVKEIHILNYDTSDMNPGAQPISDTTITYDDTYAKICLTKINLQDVDPYCDKWYFRKPTEGDYDYDGRTYNNKTYAYIGLKAFMPNVIENNGEKIPMLKIIFDDKFIHPYEGLCENAYVGAHVDVTSDYSNNGVEKKNGVVHSMGDFDGLPPYFQYMLKRTIHRAHVETYAIRDKFNKYNQKATDKQTAGIIVDSGIPQNEIQEVNADMPIVIHYDMDNNYRRRYTYDPDDPNISKMNNLSEITFTDDSHFGNSKIPKHQSEMKFVYHGNRRFSLGVSGFDPELETGRVYIISNDPAKYDNNELSDNKKPPRTFARMCDIPTRFPQLVSIRGIAPTLIIDKDYVRTEANFSFRCKDKVMNKTSTDHIIRNNKRVIEPAGVINMGVYGPLMDAQFPSYIRLNQKINIANNDIVEYSVGSPGSGYEIDDTFSFYIGGIWIRGKIVDASNGQVIEVAYRHEDDDGTVTYTSQPTMDATYIPRSNFNNRLTSYEAETISGEGSGLCIDLTIDSSEWDSSEMIVSGVLDDIHILQLDEFGAIWALTYDEDENDFVRDSQITGILQYKNINDPTTDLKYRTPKDVLIYDMINNISNDIISGDVEEHITLSNLRKSYDVTTDEDLSYYINSDSINIPGSIMVFDDGFTTSVHHNLVSYELGCIETSQLRMKYPAYNDINTPFYVNKTNKIRFDDNDQPSLWLYDYKATDNVTYKTISKDLVEIDESKPICIIDIIKDGRYTPEDLINTYGFISRNLYYNEDFSSEEMDAKYTELSELTREALMTIISRDFPNASFLRYEDTPFAYSKNMIVDYIIQNTFTWGREADYSGCGETIYRRPQAKLFRTKGEQVCDRAKRPIGKQPTGRFDIITNEIFNPNVLLNNVYERKVTPSFIFRIDTDDDQPNLEGFILYDEDNNDISDYSILIVNGVIRVPVRENGVIDWIPIKRKEEDE